MSRLHQPNTAFSSSIPETPPHYSTWQQIFSFFMRAPRVRAWLFEKSPPPHSHIVATLLSRPMLIGYIFASQQSSHYAFPDIGDLVTVFSRDGDALLGFHFGFKGLNPIMPLLFQVLKDPTLGNPTVIVRRTARQRAPYPYNDLYLGIEFNWFESGALTILTSASKLSSNNSHPSGTGPYLSRAEHRVYSKESAIRLSRLQESLACQLGSFSSNNSPHPDLPIDFIDPPDNYYVLTVQIPDNIIDESALDKGAYQKQQNFDVEKDFARPTANSSTTTVATSNTSSFALDTRSSVSSPLHTTASCATQNSSQRMALGNYDFSHAAPLAEDKGLTIAEPFTDTLWKAFQETVINSRRTGNIITMFGKKIGGRSAPTTFVFGRESRYIFLSTAGISVHGRIQRLCSQLNIHCGSPLPDQLLMYERDSSGEEQRANMSTTNASVVQNPQNVTTPWQSSALVVRKVEPKLEPSTSHPSSARLEPLYSSHVQTDSTIPGINSPVSSSGKRGHGADALQCPKRRRGSALNDIVDATQPTSPNGSQLLSPHVVIQQPSSPESGSASCHSAKEKVQLPIRQQQPPNDEATQRRSSHWTNILTNNESSAHQAHGLRDGTLLGSKGGEISGSGSSTVINVGGVSSPMIKSELEFASEHVTHTDLDKGRNTKSAPDLLKEKGGSKMVWTCDRCGVQIRGKKGNLNRHIANKHDNIRAFPCTVQNCDRKFQTRLNLIRHNTAVHLGRPFQCISCPRAFKVEEDRTAHMKAAHNAPNTQLACEFCGSCFGRRSTLNRHMTKVHKSKQAQSEASQ